MVTDTNIELKTGYLPCLFLSMSFRYLGSIASAIIIRDHKKCRLLCSKSIDISNDEYPKSEGKIPVENHPMSSPALGKLNR
uniref:SFRICE_004771 n=1 Tax=Spodoptera frugiperda TaxID=7108 RepID=A0A2H1VRY3_SPOFR